MSAPGAQARCGLVAIGPDAHCPQPSISSPGQRSPARFFRPRTGHGVERPDCPPATHRGGDRKRQGAATTSWASQEVAAISVERGGSVGHGFHEVTDLVVGQVPGNVGLADHSHQVVTIDHR
jgi:hypothetical protein